MYMHTQAYHYTKYTNVLTCLKLLLLLMKFVSENRDTFKHYHQNKAKQNTIVK